MPDISPYISVVVTSRNDDHGGDMLRRMQCFASSLGEQANRYRLEIELIVVEWNPPAQREPLLSALSWPFPSDYFSTRIITVPASIHDALDNSGDLALFQMIAKNVGIVRARGKFILCTNIDILFSPPCFLWLASRSLQSGKSYRADRLDVPADTANFFDIDERSHYCTRNVLAEGRPDRLHVNAQKGSGSTAMSRLRRAWRRFRAMLYKKEINNGNSPQSWVALKRLASYAIEKLRPSPLPAVHTIACGDFALMSKNDWHQLQGYPEWPIYSWNLDSLLLYQAHLRGIEEILLGPVKIIYHIDHSIGSGWTPTGDAALFERLEKNHIPYMDDIELTKYVSALEQNRELVFNGNNWGLSDIDLAEVSIGPPARDHLGGDSSTSLEASKSA